MSGILLHESVLLPPCKGNPEPQAASTFRSGFRAQYEPFIVSTSCLDTATKREMKQTVQTLGGHVVADWRKECAVLVMSQLSVTVKVKR